MNGRSILKSLVAATALALSAAVGATQASWAAGGPDDEADDMPGVLASPERPLAVGWIVAVDHDAGTIEIRHRALPTLDIGYMTTIFRVADPSMLLGRTPGDKIRFKVERHGRNYVVTRIENSN